MPHRVSPEKQREFALEVVRILRQAGYRAYWAGGCVRDELLGRTPKDYDVATDAHPEEIRRLFRHRKTLAVGAAFGVITVVGRRGEGQIEVATFRREDTYSDGRHPDRVHYCSPEEDAKRRDFTINGLFLDPIENRVLDFVGGQEDLRRGIIRAIGNPRQRFAEDKLRMLRAVRFAATFDFSIDPETFEAIQEMAPQILQVSGERIATELERCLTDPQRRRAVELLVASGLADVILQELVQGIKRLPHQWEENLRVLEQLLEPPFAVALAALCFGLVTPQQMHDICRRLRLSNEIRGTATWLLQHRPFLSEAPTRMWSDLHAMASSRYMPQLLLWAEALAAAGLLERSILSWWQNKLSQPRELWDPPPLITGDDLQALGLAPGPSYRKLLTEVRKRQLDGELTTREAALAFLRDCLARNASVISDQPNEKAELSVDKSGLNQHSGELPPGPAREEC